MSYGWPSAPELFPERPAPLPAEPLFYDDEHPAWRYMPDADVMEPLPEDPRVRQHREAQERAAQQAIEEMERQARFVDEYCHDGDVQMAAARAGYNMIMLGAAEILLTVPGIARAIRAKFDAMTPEDTQAYVERRLMAEARSFGKGKMPAAVVKALVEVAKLKGFTAEKSPDGVINVFISKDDAAL